MDKNLYQRISDPSKENFSYSLNNPRKNKNECAFYFGWICNEFPVSGAIQASLGWHVVEASRSQGTLD
jgi:hypothetical protein